MQVTRLSLGSVVLLFSLSACTLFPFFRQADGDGAVSPEGNSSARAVLELQNMEFDGESLSGRLLVGVKEGSLTLDKRLVENVSVELKSIVDCVAHQPIDFLEVDSFPEPPRRDELLTLSPGYWYGTDVRFSLFDEHLTGKQPPECFEAELQLRAENGSVPGRLHVRAERSARPSSPLDGGVPGP
uniref:Lipoprotein n=1 Tax=Melittangium boletus TaxID=83453 RepID=A0A3Q8I9A5_9BACT|nr:hypothetical protein [Melittangium boletus]